LKLRPDKAHNILRIQSNRLRILQFSSCNQKMSEVRHDTEEITEADEEHEIQGAEADPITSPTKGNSVRPRREPKPNPKYDDEARTLREVTRHRKEEFKGIQKILAEIQEQVTQGDTEAVKELSEALDKKMKLFHKTQERYLKCKIDERKKLKCEREMEILAENQEQIRDWLQNVEGNEDESESEDESDDETDITNLQTMLKSLKDQNKKIAKTQTKVLSELTTALRDSLMAPKQDIMKFDGNPQSYQKFWSSFNAATKGITDDHAKLNCLIQNCVGEAREAVEDLIILEPSEGFREAENILRKRYGRPHVIAHAYIEELTGGPQLKRDDVEALSKLSLRMTKCKIALKQMGYQADLNNSESLLKITRRLPMHLRAKWAERADVILELGDEPNFDHLTTFIERNARVATNMYGQDMTSTQPLKERRIYKQQRGNAYAVSGQQAVQRQNSARCGFCNSDHPTWRCDEFAKLPYASRRAATRSKGLCDNCFDRGHVSKECPKRKFCSVQGCTIRYKHSTLLHPLYPLAPEPTQNVHQQQNVLPSSPPVTGNTYSSTSTAAVCLKVVPVQIVSKNKVAETYALLDNCSDVTMCTQGLLNRLQIHGKNEQVYLNTVSGKAERKNVTKTSLEVTSIDGREKLHLDQVWGVDDLNIPSECIAKQRDINKLPHLAGINLPQASAEKVELLIGGDHPSVFWTLDERRGRRDEPVAVKTSLGWTVTGPVKRWKHQEFTTNFIKVTLEESVDRLWQSEFNDVPSLKPAASIEDHQALSVMSQSAKKIEGHYEVRPKDTGALRFLWWKDGDLEREPSEYKMLVHLFGATSSPSVCCFALRKTAEDNAHLYSSEAIDTVLRNFYMDDCLKSVETIEEAIKLQEELRSLLARGGFRLTKWMSSDKDVLPTIPESERVPSVQSLAIDELLTERTLGVEWNIKADTFQFTPQVKSKPTTKRGILSTVSSLYDPLGFVAPVTLTAKMILQELCRRGVDWDDEIEEGIAQRWREWLQNLPALTSVPVPRCYRPQSFRPVTTELHHFSDASELGYGAVSYLRFTDKTGNIHCSIVVGKSRLAPLKTISIPRLELSAAVVAVRLNTMVREQLTLPIDKTFYWTDSTAVLQYIRNTNRRFKTYVANRLTVIHEGSNVAQWKHVGTNQNPADLASRGLVPTDSDKLELWQNGPEFLWMNEQHWPIQPTTLPPIETDNEVKGDHCSFFSQKTTDCTSLGDLTRAYSSWYSLQKAIAWMTRFKQYCMHKYAKDKPKPETGPLTVQDLKNATKEIAKYVQRETYSNDIDKLRANPTKRTNGDLRKLSPILNDGVLRVGGRLENALIPESQKHPIILPGSHHVTKLLLRHHHTALGHSGSDMVLNSVRKQFWVTSGKHAIKRMISQCIKCRRVSAPLGEQIMAPLPAVRVTPNKPPFSATGVDYFGPIYVKQGRSEVKRYGCLFTCLATRAVHLEVAHSMTTDSFLGALHRFISRRGQPDVIYSDNGTNFTSANKELKNSLRALNQTRIYDDLRLKQIEWKFNPPAASHMGGTWERMIRTTRRILHMLLGEQKLNDECLLTFMTEVERIINDRPLTAPSSDASDPQPLSPNDLLLLRSNASIPTGIYDKLSCYTRRWYHQAQYLANVFWKRWVREYLPTLQQRQKWQTVRRNFKVNDVVLVSDEQVPRGKWPLARIVETYPDKEGVVRSVKVQTTSAAKVRPIDKICLLEAAV